MAQGTLEEVPHFWAVVQTSEGWRHIDLSAMNREEGPLYTDHQLLELGYIWEEDALPACGES